MKKLIFTFAAALLLFGCGTDDNKNETENYPTYDTTRETNHINDSVSSDSRSGGDMKRNVDRESENTTG